MISKLIVGLGNPGEQFENNRHNLGFHVIERVAADLEIPFDYEKKKTIFGKKNIKGMQIIVLKPQTFCNLSGEAVLYLAAFLKVNIQDITAIFDDYLTKIGKFQYHAAESGFKSEHNGLKSLTDSLKSDDYNKLSIGVGPVPKNMTVENFLLSDFTENEKSILKEIIPEASEFIRNALFA